MSTAPPNQPLTKYKLLTFVFLALAFITYALRLDILIPGLPNDSYRDTVGPVFMLIPSFILASGQIMIGGFITYMTVRTLTHDSTRMRMWQALAIGGLLTFLFSLTYAFFPYHGPIYYIAFVGGNILALPFEILWALIEIIGVAFLIRRYCTVTWRQGIFTSSFILLILTLAAS